MFRKQRVLEQSNEGSQVGVEDLAERLVEDVIDRRFEYNERVEGALRGKVEAVHAGGRDAQHLLGYVVQGVGRAAERVQERDGDEHARDVFVGGHLAKVPFTFGFLYVDLVVPGTTCSARQVRSDSAEETILSYL